MIAAIDPSILEAILKMKWIAATTAAGFLAWTFLIEPRVIRKLKTFGRSKKSANTAKNAKEGIQREDSTGRTNAKLRR